MAETRDQGDAALRAVSAVRGPRLAQTATIDLAFTLDRSPDRDLSPAVRPAVSNEIRAVATPERRSFRHRLYSNAFWSIGGRALSIGSVFVASAIMWRALPEASFAAYTIAAAAVTLLSMPASLGTPRVILRLTRESLAQGDKLRAAASIRTCLWLIALSCLVVSAIFLMGSYFLDPSSKWRAVRVYGLAVAAWFSLSAMCFSLSHALQGFDRYRAAALVGARNGGIIPNVLFAAVVAAAAWCGMLTLRTALIAQVTLHLLALIYAWFELERAVRQRASEFHNDGSQAAHHVPLTLGGLFQECWPVLLIQLTSLGIMQVDVLLVGAIAEVHAIAVYGAVARLGEILGASQILAAGIAAPFVSELLATGQKEKLERLLRGIASLVAAPTLAVAAIYLAAPNWVLEFTFGENLTDGASTLRIITIGSMIAALTGVNSLVMIMAGLQRQLLGVSATASVVYLTVAPIMIYNWSIVGAAAATAIVFGIYNVCVTMMVRQRLGVWTFASLSPQFYRFAIRQVLRR